MTDALGLLGLHRRNRELLLPWLSWYILDMGKSPIYFRKSQNSDLFFSCCSHICLSDGLGDNLLRQLFNTFSYIQNCVDIICMG